MKLVMMAIQMKMICVIIHVRLLLVEIEPFKVQMELDLMELRIQETKNVMTEQQIVIACQMHVEHPV